MGILGRQRQRLQQQNKKQVDARRSSNDFIKIIDTKIIPPFIVGEKIYDDLTRKICTVIGISYENGYCVNKKINSCHCWGIWINSDYLDGARHPWELTKTEDIRG